MLAPLRALSMVPASAAARLVKAGVYSTLLANMTRTAIIATAARAAPTMPIRCVTEICLRSAWACSFIGQPSSDLGPHDFLIGLEELVSDRGRGLEAH